MKNFEVEDKVLGSASDVNDIQRQVSGIVRSEKTKRKKEKQTGE